MRKLLTWLLVTLGIAALIRRLRRKSDGAEPASTTTAEDDPADELRRKLAESRPTDEPAPPPAAPEASVEERRADVHGQGRSTLDEMRGDDDS